MGVYEIPPSSPSRAPAPEPNILWKHADRVISLEFGPEDTVVSGSEDKTMKVGLRWKGKPGRGVQIEISGRLV